ncbi:MAG: hypothetical protein JSS09_06775, partial [Verrucomicrobia bacterium]|nr:hypothetical protein [Verrucomicrobiota bacterium]
MNIDQEIIESSLQDSNIPQESEGDHPETARIAGSDDLKVFLAAFHEMKDTEEKIRFAIEFMRIRLTGFVSPKFREFWEVRKLCLP